MPQRLLFNTQNIFDVMQRRKKDLQEAVYSFPQAGLDDPESPGILAKTYGLEVPTLDETQKYAKTAAVDIDVSRDPMRNFIYGGFMGPSYVKGSQINIFIPFEGDAGLFDVRPTTFDSNPPRGEVVGSELCLSYEMIDADAQLAPQIEGTLASIRRYLDWLRPSAGQLGRELEQQAREMISQRKERHSAHSNALKSLGIPIHSQDKSAHISAATKTTERAAGRKNPGHGKKWDVFISHASEDKDEIARPLERALRNQGLAVWYDETSLKLGDSLRQAIEAGLSRSRFGVVILSHHFFEKHWPQQELNGLATREVDGQKVILPVWHNLGFEEVRAYSTMLADRLAVRTSAGISEVVKKILEVVK